MDKTDFAKRLCEDDANLIEILDINASEDSTTNDIISDILNKNRFDIMYRKQVEQMSANGTVGAYVTVSNAEIYEDGTFSGGEIRINYCDSMNILPLTVINDEIVEVNEGDVIYTADGNKHYIENIGDEDLVFIAVVINE